MKGISAYISEVLAEQGIIQKDEEETCKYGLEVFFSSVFEVLSVIIFSIFINNFVNTLVFFVAFLPLRIYSGGYHADSKIRCYLILLFVYAIFCMAIKFVPIHFLSVFGIVSAGITTVIVCLLSPVIHPNRTVTAKEKIVYRRISLFLAFAGLIITVGGFAIWQNSTLILSFSMGQLAVSLSMIAALIKTYLQKEVKSI